MAGKAKQARDEWEIKLLGVHQTLMDMCGLEPIQKRAVTRKMTELDNIWQRLIENHGHYCRAAKIGISSKDSTDFLREKEKLKEEVTQMVETALAIEDVGVGKIKRLKKLIEHLKSDVDIAISTLEDLVTEEKLAK